MIPTTSPSRADRGHGTGKRVVVANGYARQRDVVTGAGPVTVEAPRVNDKRYGERFSSRILPVYMRRVSNRAYRSGRGAGRHRVAARDRLNQPHDSKSSTTDRFRGSKNHL